MKLIRRIALTALVTFTTFGAVTFTSCNPDECKDVICNNGGSCNSTDGSCTCATGYEGAACETEMRKKFMDTWTASDKEVGGSDLPTYNSSIVAGSGVTEVKISNFSDYFVNDVIATVSGSSITIASQDPDNDLYRVEGTGTFNAVDGKITWTYTITNPANLTKSYTGTWQ